MKDISLTSPRINGEIIYRFNDQNELDGFQIMAIIQPNQRRWLYQNIPLTYEQLVAMSKLPDTTFTLTEIEPDLSFERFWNTYNYKVGKKKSLELLHTVIGFRTGTPKVEKNKKFTWDAVTELLQKGGKKFSDFLRTKTEINKEAILAIKDEQLLADLKDECYIEVVQTETFYVEAKREQVPA